MTMPSIRQARALSKSLGVDGVLTKTSAAGLSGYNDTTFSGGQTIAYGRPNGPQFRLRLGQEQNQMRLNDETYYSSQDTFGLTATLDLSRYLQWRFERPDLRVRKRDGRVVRGRGLA